MKKLLLTFLMLLCIGMSIDAQSKLTKEQILAMSMDELSDLPLETLMEAVETLGVSSVDELFAMIMNKNVSSASKSEETAFTSPLSSTVMTREEMRSYGISTIEEAFRLIPGVIVEQKTNGNYNVYIRGLNNLPDNNLPLYTETSNVLVMIDGRITHNYASGNLMLETLPISVEDVERIEVVRGASSALYGQNAVQGIINIITDKPSQTSKMVSGSFQMGTQNTVVGDLALRFAPNDKIALGITANRQYRERPTDKLYLMPAQGLVKIVAPAAYEPGCTVADYIKLSAFANNFVPDMIVDPATGAPSEGADVSQGGMFSLSELQNNIKQLYTDGTMYDILEAEKPIVGMFPNGSELARKSLGVNGYITLTPTPDVRIDITGGYQQSFVNTTGILSDYFNINGREVKNGYANIVANIKNLSLNIGYSGGPQDYCVGRPALKEHSNLINAQVDYDIKISDQFSIRPEIFYQAIYMKDYPNESFDFSESYHNMFFDHVDLNGFFNQKENNYAFAPSVRLDYHTLNNWRFIAALRGDKTRFPDKWNMSWQLAISKQINENNFIRLSYGRATRSAVLINTSASYIWDRTGLVSPQQLHFVGNPEADLQYSDAVELGYRWRPSQNVLIDAELFYSLSQDYGALMAKESCLTMPKANLAGVMQGIVPIMQGVAEYQQQLATQLENGEITQDEYYAVFSAYKDQLISSFLPMFSSNLYTDAYMQFNNLPYKVHQGGISVNMDWIISSKLIAKVNLNYQKTIINDYFKYSQNDVIRNQLTTAVATLQKGLATYQDPETGLTWGMLPEALYIGQNGGNMLTSCYIDFDDNWFESLSEQQQVDFRNAAIYGQGAAWLQANAPEYYKQIEGKDAQYQRDQAAALYLGSKYHVDHDADDNLCVGNSAFEQPALEDNHEHKATPNFYGMVGLMYRPSTKLNVSAFANFMTERELAISTANEPIKLDPRVTVSLKVGYKPIDGCEIFFNANNLFNSEDREFGIGDEVGGLYTFGVNFGF
ncbi:MAG: TonB-dependent receptor [Marinilabiliaceae bacterium]|nr:TonB-dependent receptor [Marinilabiliaceae bacterium]